MRRNSYVRFCSIDEIQAQLSNPKKIIFHKQYRGKMKGIYHRENHISFNKYALQAFEPVWITSRQIEASRRAILRNVPHGKKYRYVWVQEKDALNIGELLLIVSKTL